MKQEMLAFPKGFLWGTATASHQVEGNNTNNNWYIWEQTPGKIVGGAKAGLACDWWNGRWKEDLKHAVEDGQNTHRLSIEWSRIEPEPGKWNAASIQAYREMLQGIIKLGLKPMLTLHHFTDPIWIYEKGGWENEETANFFARYVEKIVQIFHDLTDMWITINEPTVYVFGGYMSGEFPPGKSDPKAAFQVMCNLVRGHARAYRAIHKIQPHAMVGFAKNFRAMIPARKWFPPDHWIKTFSYNSFNNAFANTLVNGKLKFALWKESIPEAIGTQDYIGVNYYTRDQIKFNLLSAKSVFQERYFNPNAELSENGFIANEPIGFTESLQWAQRYGLPIYITENGVEDSRDSMRPHYLITHLYQLWKAIQGGIDIRGYMHWSQVDNFEWERAWTQRFGLWGLNIETQERIRRPSVDIYHDICTQNAIPLESIAHYAPELQDEIQ
ncbi:MAG: glycoside hydrolase family 1 protein [Anaerolineaceae bacterium]|jgi:beta-glucosidase|nr:MAG: glycoside hydrolase family 1 protein [Anaerolineaceae bacterium]